MVMIIIKRLFGSIGEAHKAHPEQWDTTAAAVRDRSIFIIIICTPK